MYIRCFFEDGLIGHAEVFDFYTAGEGEGDREKNKDLSLSDIYSY